MTENAICAWPRGQNVEENACFAKNPYTCGQGLNLCACFSSFYPVSGIPFVPLDFVMKSMTCFSSVSVFRTYSLCSLVNCLHNCDRSILQKCNQFGTQGPAVCALTDWLCAICLSNEHHFEWNVDLINSPGSLWHYALIISFYKLNLIGMPVWKQSVSFFPRKKRWIR